MLIGARKKSQPVIEFLSHELNFFSERFKMVRLICRQQVTVASKATIDIFFFHDLFHGVNRLERALEQPPCKLPPIFLHHRLHSKLESSQHHPTIARTRPPPNGVCFQHSNTDT